LASQFTDAIDAVSMANRSEAAQSFESVLDLSKAGFIALAVLGVAIVGYAGMKR
jgi:hypothetical protein